MITKKVSLVFLGICSIALASYGGYQWGQATLRACYAVQKTKPTVAVIEGARIPLSVKGFQKLEFFIRDTRHSLEQKIEKHRINLEKKQKDLQEKFQTLKNASAQQQKNLTAEKEALEKTITGLHKLVSEKKEAFEKQITDTNNTLQNAFKEAIHFIAQRDAIELVIDASMAAFYQQKVDITAEVIQYMNQNEPSIKLKPIVITDDEISGIIVNN